MPPAARVTDMHTCPMFTGIVPHVGGPILPPGHPTTLIGFLPAARIGDMVTCVGPPDTIVKGSPTVLIGGMPAARMGDNTAHGGVIVLGHPTTMIGDAGSGGGGGGGGGGGPGVATTGSGTGTAGGVTAAREAGGSAGGGAIAATSIQAMTLEAGLTVAECECSNPECANAFTAAAEEGAPLVDREADGCAGPPGQTVGIGTHWIEIELVGEDDRGIAGEAYTIKLPDGAEAHGHLDPNGMALLEGLEQSGVCSVQFPNLDRDAWEEIG